MVTKTHLEIFYIDAVHSEDPLVMWSMIPPCHVRYVPCMCDHMYLVTFTAWIAARVHDNRNC